uniref:Uncharacterized protein n=1 Tax=viral metagenome TaxID=1070528 RepID=A0A6M3KZC3_9ZZZZ
MSRKNTAGSSVTDLIGVKPVSFLNGGAVPTWSFPELSGTQAFKAGEMVCLSGAVGSAIGLTKPGTDASGFGIVGFAADNASGTTSGKKSVWIASPDVVWQGNVGHSTSASAQTAATDLGQRFGLTSLSGRTYVDKARTAVSTVMCRVIGLCNQDDVPTFYGKVYFTLMDRVCQLRQDKVYASSPLDMAL